MNNYKIKIAAQVERDLNEIELYMLGWGTYQQTIDDFINHVYDRIEALLLHPFMGEDLGNKTIIPTNLRYLVVDDYLIFYEVIADQINIYRVVSQRKDYIRLLKL